MSDLQTATKYPDLFAALAAPFDDVKTRKAGGGRELSYITARQAMIRLDEVVGPECWWDDYYDARGVLFCRLSVQLPDGTILVKCGAGGFKVMEEKNRQGDYVVDQENTDKTGESDAFKRAAAKFGVARYLYKDGVPDFVSDREPERSAPPQRRDRDEPPPRREVSQRDSRSSGGGGGGGGGKYGNLPRSGGALFAWSKKMEQDFDIGLIKYLDGWAKLQNLPRSWKDWNEEEVALGVKEAVRKLDSLPPPDGDDQQGDDDNPF